MRKKLIKCGMPNMEQPKTSLNLVTKIRTEIIPALEKGDKLPTERSLSEKYGVSRTIIREALMILEMHGIIETKRGSGSILKQKEPADILEDSTLAEVGPFELIQARLVLECAVVRLAASLASPTDIRELTQILKSHEYYLYTNFDYEKIDYYDTLFHIRIAEATHNLALIQTITTVRRYSGTSESWQIFKQYIEKDKAQLELSLQEHQKILGAISCRTSKEAVTAMYNHIQRKWGTLKSELQKRNIQLDNLLFDLPEIS
jgi:GntR family transcriptional regulator, uxu operon transcriptional repressor